MAANSTSADKSCASAQAAMASRGSQCQNLPAALHSLQLTEPGRLPLLPPHGRHVDPLLIRLNSFWAQGVHSGPPVPAGHLA
jgi:hypothetical protein